MKSFSGTLGYLLVGLFIYIAVTKGTSKPELFLNLHGIAIVFGGVFVAALASFPHTLLWSAIRSTVKALTTNSTIDPDVAEKVVRLSSAYQKGMSELEKESQGVEHKFLIQCNNLILEGLNVATVVEIINKRIEERRMTIQNQMNVMLTLSKYSPALGLAATVLGLVDLLGQLHDADMAKLGVGMAVALAATFYGVVLSNLVFAPISEMIASIGEVETKEMELIRDGYQCGMERKHPLIIGEVVNSYLDEDHRINFIERLQIKKAA
jgi:chemotaxis protein MotA